MSVGAVNFSGAQQASNVQEQKKTGKTINGRPVQGKPVQNNNQNKPIASTTIKKNKDGDTFQRNLIIGTTAIATVATGVALAKGHGKGILEVKGNPDSFVNKYIKGGLNKVGEFLDDTASKIFKSSEAKQTESLIITTDKEAAKTITDGIKSAKDAADKKVTTLKDEFGKLVEGKNADKIESKAVEINKAETEIAALKKEGKDVPKEKDEALTKLNKEFGELVEGKNVDEVKAKALELNNAKSVAEDLKYGNTKAQLENTYVQSGKAETNAKAAKEAADKNVEKLTKEVEELKKGSDTEKITKAEGKLAFVKDEAKLAEDKTGIEAYNSLKGEKAATAEASTTAKEADKAAEKTATAEASTTAKEADKAAEKTATTEASTAAKETQKTAGKAAAQNNPLNETIDGLTKDLEKLAKEDRTKMDTKQLAALDAEIAAKTTELTNAQNQLKVLNLTNEIKVLQGQRNSSSVSAFERTQIDKQLSTKTAELQQAQSALKK